MFDRRLREDLIVLNVREVVGAHMGISAEPVKIVPSSSALVKYIRKFSDRLRSQRKMIAMRHARNRHRVIDTVGGLWELFLLLAKTRFRIGKSSYWTWRIETAFGTDHSRMPSRRERWRAILDYGRWVYRTKRGR